jgi:hypothetical protein
MVVMGYEDLVEGQKDIEKRMLEERLSELQSEFETTNFVLQEKLADLDRVMGDENWSSLLGYNDEGPSLAQLQKRSKQIRNALALSPHVKRGAQLRSSYVWSSEIRYESVPGWDGAPVGRGVRDVGRLMREPLNRRYVFGSQARDEREKALYTDGGYLLLGDDRSRVLRPVPLTELTAYYTNPDNSNEIWAYRRQWYSFDASVGSDVSRAEWVYTDLFKDRETTNIRYNGVLEPVNRNATIIDGWVNTQDAWALGFPDAGCIIEWARIYSEFLKSGKIMTDAMARIWAVAKAQSGSGGQAVAAKIGNATGYGNTVVGNELSPLSTAGRAYDFDAGRALISVVATGIEVSVIHLTSDPGAAGSSYGSAATLDLPSRLATESRRRWHEEFDERVLRWMGAVNPVARFAPMEDGAELFRKMQAIILKWNSGLYAPEEIKAEFELLAGRAESGSIPAGVLIPNNELSAARRDIDPVSATVNTPGQGANTGVGENPDGADDMRDDTLT